MTTRDEVLQILKHVMGKMHMQYTSQYALDLPLTQ